MGVGRRRAEVETVWINVNTVHDNVHTDTGDDRNSHGITHNRFAHNRRPLMSSRNPNPILTPDTLSYRQFHQPLEQAMSRHADLVMRSKLGVQRAAQLVQESESRLAKVRMEGHPICVPSAYPSSNLRWYPQLCFLVCPCGSRQSMPYTVCPTSRSLPGGPLFGCPPPEYPPHMIAMTSILL